MHMSIVHAHTCALPVCLRVHVCMRVSCVHVRGVCLFLCAEPSLPACLCVHVCMHGSCVHVRGACLSLCAEPSCMCEVRVCSCAEPSWGPHVVTLTSGSQPRLVLECWVAGQGRGRPRSLSPCLPPVLRGQEQREAEMCLQLRLGCWAPALSGGLPRVESGCASPESEVSVLVFLALLTTLPHVALNMPSCIHSMPTGGPDARAAAPAQGPHAMLRTRLLEAGTPLPEQQQHLVGNISVSSEPPKLVLAELHLCAPLCALLACAHLLLLRAV